MNICCIVGAGDCPEFDFKKNDGDLIIAADGGFRHLLDYGIKPDVAIGDFDSLGYIPDDIEIIKLPAEKDVTDMVAAVETGIKKGYKTFYIYGGCGGRIDHTISNLQLSASVAEKGLKVFIRDGKTVISAIHNESLVFDSTYIGYFSVFSHSDISKGVTIKGLKYLLENAELSCTNPLGVSNEFIGEEAEITVENGTLIIVYSH